MGLKFSIASCQEQQKAREQKIIEAQEREKQQRLEEEKRQRELQRKMEEEDAKVPNFCLLGLMIVQNLKSKNPQLVSLDMKPLKSIWNCVLTHT